MGIKTVLKRLSIYFIQKRKVRQAYAIAWRRRRMSIGAVALRTVPVRKASLNREKYNIKGYI